MISVLPERVRTSQRGLHPRLDSVVCTHLRSAWHGGAHAPTEIAFRALAGIVAGELGRGLILDSGCGTGESTRLIAAVHPECLVIGIDRSAARLARLNAPVLPHREGNAVWIRAELATFWRLARESGWHLERHYLLYPNPWPKASQLRRRWHGHPVFPTLLALGGRIELRTNWPTYAREFARAARIVTGAPAPIGAVGESLITSPFERKFGARGEPLVAVRLNLP